MPSLHRLRALCLHTLLILLAACSNGRGSLDDSEQASAPPPPAGGAQGTFSVGGSVAGLSGSGLALRLNGGNDLPIASNGTFTFGSQLGNGAQYTVTVGAPPSNPAQVCTVANGSGTIDGANVTTVQVTCASNAFVVGGTVVSLLGRGLVLQNNGEDSIGIDGNGAFSFPKALASGTAYNVTVRTQPTDPHQACSVANGRGTIGSADVTNVLVNCNTSDFTIGGTLQNLAGSGLVLRNNGLDDLRIDANGAFAFDTALPSGATYRITIAEQPKNPDQTCTLSNGSGIVSGANVTNIVVQCSTSGYLVGGHVSELRGSGLVLQNNGGDNLEIASNGSFDFATPLPSGSPYNVTVARQPVRPEQTCTVKNGAGTIRNSNVDNVEVKCRGERGDDDDDDDDGGGDGGNDGNDGGGDGDDDGEGGGRGGGGDGDEDDGGNGGD